MCIIKKNKTENRPNFKQNKSKKFQLPLILVWAFHPVFDLLKAVSKGNTAI